MGSPATMREVVPGIFHWTTFHEAIRAHVSSYAVPSAGIVIDPKVPDDGLGALPDRPEQVVLTSGHHGRDAERFADAFDIPIVGSLEARDHLGGALDVEEINDGDEVAPGVTYIHIGTLADDEGALHIAVDRGAIAFADALNTYSGALGFFPDELLGDDPDRVKAGLKDAFRGLLTRDFAHLLFAHGEPIVGGGKSELREFAKSDAGEERF
jgi:hypothetical protein